MLLLVGCGHLLLLVVLVGGPLLVPAVHHVGAVGQSVGLRAGCATTTTPEPLQDGTNDPALFVFCGVAPIKLLGFSVLPAEAADLLLALVEKSHSSGVVGVGVFDLTVEVAGWTDERN